MIRDDYGCDWLIESRRQRWRYILDEALRDMIRQAYMTVRLEFEIAEMWKRGRR